MKNFKVILYQDNVETDSWTFQARNPKGVEKLNKQKFKKYREEGIVWKIEEIM